MKRISFLVLYIAVILQATAQFPNAKILTNPNSNKVYVASHRCDWRNHPENSIIALESAIEMGADIAEIDVSMTKDSVLILMHDKTINRTTSGKGKPSDYTIDEIRKFNLRNGLGRVTHHKIPTFREFLLLAKGKVIINIDKGYEYFPQVLKELNETETISQAIININSNTTLDEVEALYGKVPSNVMLMPVLAYKNKKRASETLKSFLRHGNTIFQPVWSDDSQIADVDFFELRKLGYGIWVNSLWASLCGGHDDDRAVEQDQFDETWCWLVLKGASIIQDRLDQQIEYIRKKNMDNKSN